MPIVFKARVALMATHFVSTQSSVDSEGVSVDGKIRRQADSTRLKTWDELRLRYAGIGEDARDRSASGFVDG